MASRTPDNFTLTDPELYDDPWDIYAWLREQGPWFDERSGMWAITRHADVMEASRDAEHFSAAQGVRPISLVPLSIVSMDDPEHARQRRVLSRGFTPRRVRTLTDHVRQITNEVIDEVQGHGAIDFVSDLAMHVPLIVISELLGLDPSLRTTLYGWSDAMIGAEGHEDLDHPAALAGAVAFGEYTTLIAEAIEQRRSDPTDDLLSVLTAAYDDGDVQRLLGDAGIVRHRGKIESTINNAQRCLELREAEGSLLQYVQRFRTDTPTRTEQPPFIPATTPESTAMSKDLKKRGWSFVGPTTVYAFMQAMGLVNDHLEGCFAREHCARPN